MSCWQALSLLQNQPELLAICTNSTTHYDSESVNAGLLGSYSTCIESSQLQYCLAGGVDSQRNPASPIGSICIPNSCSSADLSSASLREGLEELAIRFPSSYFSSLNALVCTSTQLELGFSCSTDTNYCPYTDTLVLVMVVFGAYLVLVVGATIADITKKKYELLSNFSIRHIYHDSKRALANVFAPSNGSSFIFFDGIRALSLLWIIAAHLFAITSGIGYENSSAFQEFTSTPLMQILCSSRFAVDNFLFISGFLTMWKGSNALRRNQLESRNGLMPWMINSIFYYLKLVLDRYIRLAPMLFISLFTWWWLAPRIGHGPFWYRWDYYKERCNRFSWTNILFVNNIEPYSVTETSECLYVSWYLAVDWQLFLTAPFVIGLDRISSRVAIIVVAAACLVSCSAAYTCTIKYNWSPHNFDGIWVLNYAKYYYTKPQFRAPPYLIGMLTAIFENMKLHDNWTKFQYRCIVVTSLLTMLCIIFLGWSAYQDTTPCTVAEDPTSTGCGSQWSVNSRALYIALTKSAWSVALGGLLLGYCSNTCSPLYAFLSCGVFRFFSRYSYGVYLFHVTIINVIVFSFQNRPRFSFLEMGENFVIVTSASLVISILVTELTESPIRQLRVKQSTIEYEEIATVDMQQYYETELTSKSTLFVDESVDIKRNDR